MELVMPVPPSRAVPSAPCWESRLEPSQGFGDQERRDAPSTPVCQASTALRMLGGSRACPGSLLGDLRVSRTWQHLQTWVGGRKGCWSGAKCRAWLWIGLAAPGRTRSPCVALAARAGRGSAADTARVSVSGSSRAPAGSWGGCPAQTRGLELGQV